MPEPDLLPRLRSVVPFLYVVADRSWLPGSVLVQLLVDIGATEDRAREVLTRMRADGSLGTERRGRETDFQLASLVRFATWRAQAASDPERFTAVEQSVWEGTFSGLMYAVPKAERRARKRFRRAARLAGYGPLRPGLMIGVRSGWMALADAVADLPLTGYAQPVTLGMKTDDARRAAAEAWQLDRAAVMIDRAADRLETAGRAPVDESGAPALRAYVDVALPAYRLLMRVPSLPRELQAEGWPMARMITVLADVRAGAGLTAQHYVDELLSSGRLSEDSSPVGE